MALLFFATSVMFAISLYMSMKVNIDLKKEVKKVRQENEVLEDKNMALLASEVQAVKELKEFKELHFYKEGYDRHKLAKHNKLLEKELLAIIQENRNKSRELDDIKKRCKKSTQNYKELQKAHARIAQLKNLVDLD